MIAIVVVRLGAELMTVSDLTTYTTLYALLDTQTHSFVAFKGKMGWATIGAAKSAYTVHHYNPKTYSYAKYEEQTRYRVVPIHALMCNV